MLGTDYDSNNSSIQFFLNFFGYVLYDEFLIIQVDSWVSVQC